METWLALDGRSKQLCLHAKKTFQHSSDVALKVKGVLNTVTAAYQVDGALFKFLRLGRLPAYAEDDVYRPDPRLQLGLGARASTRSDDVFLSATAKQRVSLASSTDYARGRQVLRSYTQAALQATYDYNLRTDRGSGAVVAALSHARFRFSDDQDVRVMVGVSAPLTASGFGRAEPFVRVQENCWGVRTDMRGSWQVTYCL